MSAETVDDVVLPDPEVTPDEGVIQPAEPKTETERLDPEPTALVLQDGTPFELESLRLRQFLRLLRILTRGGATMMATISPDPSSDDFVQQLMAVLIFAIPEAEDETVQFVQTIVKPANMHKGPGITKAQAGENGKAISELIDKLENPELEDLITILQGLIEQEGDDLKALGKRLAAMFKAAQKMGAVPTVQTPAL